MVDLADTVLEIAEHRGIISYQPSELVVTVRAGTPLLELQAVLAEQGQMLAAECPDFGEASTVGGAIALGWSGSRGFFSGSLRDAVLGLRMINGFGDILSFGGEVMKNVAGFDVSRLLVGSCGRLGAILDVSLKVLPRAAAEITIAQPVASLHQARQLVRELVLAGEPLSGFLFMDQILYLRLSGRVQTIERLRSEYSTREMSSSVWRQLAAMDLPFFATGQNTELYDGNGRVRWFYDDKGSLWRQQGAAAAVNLDSGPKVEDRRLLTAFDPKSVFRQLRRVSLAQ